MKNNEWVHDMKDSIKANESKLKDKTGLDYITLAAKASGWSVSDLKRAAQQIKVGIVPISSGEGVSDTFSEAVAAVARIMDFTSFVAECSDMNGIYEAHRKDADILFMADDERYISFSLNKKKIADNNVATAAGYLTALEEAQGGLVGKEVLLLGFGVLGQEFLKRLLKKGIRVTGYDTDEKRMKAMGWSGATALSDISEMQRFKVVIDATSQGNWIHTGMLHPDAWIAAPGIPLSLDQEAYLFHENQLIHDFLEIGTATMLGMTL